MPLPFALITPRLSQFKYLSPLTIICMCNTCVWWRISLAILLHVILDYTNKTEKIASHPQLASWNSPTHSPPPHSLPLPLLCHQQSTCVDKTYEKSIWRIWVIAKNYEKQTKLVSSTYDALITGEPVMKIKGIHTELRTQRHEHSTISGICKDNW